MARQKRRQSPLRGGLVNYCQQWTTVSVSRLRSLLVSSEVPVHETHYTSPCKGDLIGASVRISSSTPGQGVNCLREGRSGGVKKSSAGGPVRPPECPVLAGRILTPAAHPCDGELAQTVVLTSIAEWRSQRGWSRIDESASAQRCAVPPRQCSIGWLDGRPSSPSDGPQDQNREERAKHRSKSISIRAWLTQKY
jgi:hypothetical protein